MAQPDQPMHFHDICGICLTGHDIGLPTSQIAYIHPECPDHGTSSDETAAAAIELKEGGDA